MYTRNIIHCLIVSLLHVCGAPKA